MRGLVLTGQSRIEVRDDLSHPEILEATDVVIRVDAAGLCGSDLHPYLGREPIRWGHVPGHEAVGTVSVAGSNVKNFAVGDRVVVPFTTSCGLCSPCKTGLSSRCSLGQLFGWASPDATNVPGLPGAQAQALRVPLADGTLVKVPVGMSDEDALLLCDNAPTGWHAASRAEVRDGSRVAVIGLGAVGLCAVWASLALGADEVIAIDPVASRQGRARSLGANVAYSPGEVPADLRVSCVIEAAGPIAAQRQAVHLAAPGATISVIAVQTERALGFSGIDAYDKNLTVRFGRAPVRSVLDDLLPRLSAGLELPTSTVITESRLPLSAGPDAYARFAARDPNLVKAAFAPND